ncbi:MAG: transposase [Burkholderiales bacterium]|nr:transposase [Burkholderiales bacterium]
MQKKAAIPKACQHYQSKCEIALLMIEAAKQRGVRFGYVGIDGGYGKDPAFLRGVDKLGCTFVADVHCRQMIYLEDPMPSIPARNSRGRQPKHLNFHEANAAWPIIKYAGGMHSIITWRWSCWQRYSWSSKRCLGASNGRCYPSNDLVTALAHMLLQRQLTTEDLADIIHKQHRRRLSAKKSSARRKVAFE